MRRLLLDTHTFLWFIQNDLNLSDLAKNMARDPQNQVFLSTASVWEICIKFSLKKLTLPDPVIPFIDTELKKNRISVLPIGFHHLDEVSKLSLHHRDPFDRLIIAQAITEQMPLLSRDSAFDAYPIQRLW